MAVQKVVEIYLDTTNSTQTGATGGGAVKRSSVFILHRATVSIVRAHLIDLASNYISIPAGTEFFFYIDNSYVVADLAPVKTLDQTLFNRVADWAEVDYENGKVCWEVDTTSTALLAKFTGADPTNPALLEMTAELWMQAPAESRSLLAQWPMTMRNIISDDEGSSELIYTQTNVVRFDGDDVVLLYPDGSVAQRWSRE